MSGPLSALLSEKYLLDYETNNIGTYQQIIQSIFHTHIKDYFRYYVDDILSFYSEVKYLYNFSYGRITYYL